MMMEENSTVNGAANIFVVSYSQGIVCQNSIAVMKEYNVKRHYTTEHSSQFDEILGQARVDKIEHLKKFIKNSKVSFPVARMIRNWLKT